MPDIKIVDEVGNDITEEARDINPTPENVGIMEGEIDRLAVAQVLDISRDDIDSNKEKIDTIVAWAKTQTDGESLQDLKWIVKNLEMKLNSPGFGEKSITRVARYAHLDLETKKMESEKESLYG